MKYDTYIFDVDGTLLDTSEGIGNALNQICERFGLAKISKEQAKKYVGPPLAQVILNMYPQATKEQVERGVEIYREYFSRRGMYEAELYDGMGALLGYLKNQGARLGVASLKYQEAVELTINHFKLNRYFDVSVGGDTYGKLTKHDVIEKCIAKLGAVDRNRIVMIGDSPYDAEGAVLSGIDFIAAIFGFGFTVGNVKDYSPVLSISSPMDILNAINRSLL